MKLGRLGAKEGANAPQKGEASLARAMIPGCIFRLANSLFLPSYIYSSEWKRALHRFSFFLFRVFAKGKLFSGMRHEGFDWVLLGVVVANACWWWPCLHLLAKGVLGTRQHSEAVYVTLKARCKL